MLLSPFFHQFLISHDLNNWTLIDLPGVEDVHKDRNAHESHEQDESVVQSLRVWFVGVWPEGPEEAPGRVDDGDDVAGETEFAQRPAGGGKWSVLTDATSGDAAYGDQVSSHQSNGTEGKHGVEGDGAANVD